MRKTSSPFEVNRWDWYARGDDSVVRRAARGATNDAENNSSDRVLWECGLVIAVPLACAALVELALKVSGV
jgi:hypothetical protein